MTTRNVFKFVVTLALVFAVVGALGVFTAKASRKSFSTATHVNGPPTAAAVDVLKKTRVVYGTPFLMLPKGKMTQIDFTNKLSCPGPGTCTYQSETWLQISALATTDWALITTLDGVIIGAAPFFGPTNGTNETVGSWSDVSTSVSMGSHTLKTYAMPKDANATANTYNFTYRMYQP